MKKIRLYFVSLLLSAVSMNTWAYVNGDKLTIDGWTYQVTDIDHHEVRVIGTEHTGNVTIPSTFHDGADVTFTVTSIGGDNPSDPAETQQNGAWHGVTGVTIPETVTELAPYCFHGATIETLNIPKNVTKIGDGKGGTTGQALVHANIQKIVVDPANTSFDSENGCLYTEGYKEVICIPSNIQLSDGTLHINENCTRLGVFSLGDRNSTPNNSNLKKLQIPASLESVWAFFAPAYLEEYEVYDTPGADNFSSPDGLLVHGNVLEQTPYRKTFEETEGKLTVPDVVTVVNTAGIQNYYITELDLNNVVTLKERAINSNRLLKKITIPKDLKDLEGGISLNYALTEYEVDSENQYFCAPDGVIYSKDQTTLVLYPTVKTGATYTPVCPITKIANMAFYGAYNLQEFTVPKDVTDIGNGAFSLSHVTDFKFAEDSQLKTIGSACFDSSLLQNIGRDDAGKNHLPAGLESIGTGAFHVTSIDNITIPSSVTTIGSTAFSTCTSLTDVTIENGSSLTTLGTEAFGNCPELESFDFGNPTGLKTIPGECFFLDEKLKSIVIPDNVETIQKGAFFMTDLSGGVTLNEGLKEIDEGAFADCNIGSIVTAGGNYALPKTIETLKEDAFRKCGALTVVDLSARAKSIDPRAFRSCENLLAINVDCENETYSSGDGMLLNREKTTLVIFPHAKANDRFILLPPTITTIGAYSFYDCPGLKHVTLPQKVNKIEERAFGFCTNLTSLTLLCDKVLDPANIAQQINEASIDDTQTTTDEQFSKIKLYVRATLLPQYTDENTDVGKYYSHFQKPILSSFTVDDIEYIPVNDQEENGTIVAMLAVLPERENTVPDEFKEYTFVVPYEVTNGGKTYKVGLIGDYCFQNAPENIKEVVVFNYISYIGAKAFMTNITDNTSTIESIFLVDENASERLLATTRFLLDNTGTDYSEIANTTHVYMKKSAVENYKTAFSRYLMNVYPCGKDDDESALVRKATPELFSYKIPGINLSSKTFGTFSREFDIDLGDVDENGDQKWWDNEKDCPKVIAFTAVEDKNDASYLQGNKYVRMHSIKEGGAKDVDGLYVPGNTGVVLKAIGDFPTDFYYRIGENDEKSYGGENVMQDASVKNRKVQRTDGDYMNFYLSGDKLWNVPTGGMTIPVHKSYMKLKNVSAGAKVFMVFDENEATSIEALDGIDVEDAATGVVYDLQGRRVENPQNGIYVKDGKKIVVK